MISYYVCNIERPDGKEEEEWGKARWEEERRIRRRKRRGIVGSVYCVNCEGRRRGFRV